jgi:hypothetical protein
LNGKLCPRTATKLEEIVLEAIDCVAQYAGESMFEVTFPDNRQFVVDLHRRRCGCKSGKLPESLVPMQWPLYYMIVGILRIM